MEVTKFTKTNDSGNLKGFLTIKTSEGFEMKGFKFMDGQNGLWVASPSRKGKDDDGNDKWYDIVWIPKELNQTLLDLVANHVDLTADSPTTNNPVPF